MKFKEHILALIAPKPKPGAILLPGLTLYGDSIMANSVGWRITLGGGIVEDRSIAGDTAREAWARFPYERRSTGWVVLQPGTNDLTNGDDPVPYLKLMADYAIAEGRNVLLTGISQRVDQDVSDVNVDIWRAAEDVGARFGYWHFATLDASDGLHPEPMMARTLADLTLNAIGEAA